MIFEGIGIFLDDSMSCHVVLDPILCRKRDLTDAIIDQVDKLMRELIVEKKAHFFEIHHREFKKFWNRLEQQDDSIERQFTLAQATPRLKGLRIKHNKADRVEFTWSQSEAKKANPDWLWLEFRYFLESTGITFGAIPAQLHQLYFQFILQPTDEMVTFALFTWHASECIEPFEVIERDNSYYIQISPRARQKIAEIENAAKSKIKNLIRNSINLRVAYSDLIWKRLADELTKGPTSIEVFFRDVFFVGMGTAFPATELISDISSLAFAESSSLIYEHVNAPSALVLKANSSLAKESLVRFSSNERFLSNALISYDMNQLSSLFKDSNKELYVIPEGNSSDGNSINYLLSMQIYPVFECNHEREYPPQLGASNVAWLKSLLREAAMLNGFRVDTDWLRARLNLPLQRSEIRKTIDSLIKLRLILPTEVPGHYTVAKEQLVTDVQVHGTEIGKYYESVYDSSYDIAKTLPPWKFYWCNRIIRFSPVQFEAMRDELIKISKGMLERERQCNVRNGILQISTQLIPIKAAGTT